MSRLSQGRYPFLALAACLLLGPVARAAFIPILFSGGSGTKLTITLPVSITYNITGTPSGGILFDFEDVGNIFGGTLNESGTITYSDNGLGATPINAGNTGQPDGAITITDLLLLHNPTTAAAHGDTIVLSAGSVTTAINIAGAAPANGSYSAILVDSNGSQVAAGTIPEPTSAALLAVGGLSFLGRRRGRRRSRRRTAARAA